MVAAQTIAADGLGRLMLIRIASRSSFLAKWQAYQVGHKLQKTDADIQIEYHFRESLGDKNLTDPLWKMPEKGVFTEDFYSDLIQNRCDLVVHSWKDLPTEEKEKTFIAATLQRADSRDLLLFKKTSVNKTSLRIFSSSPRRVHHVNSILKWSLPFKFEKLEFVNVRGNIQTRIKKLLQDENVDGLILAKAALDRLLDRSFYDESDFLELQNLLRSQLKNFEFQILPLSLNPTAAAQGALAIEILRSRTDLNTLLQKINQPDDFSNCHYERQKLSEFGGGCHQKIGLSVVSLTSQTNHKVFFASGETENRQKIEHKGVINQKTFKFSTQEIMVSTELWAKVERHPLSDLKKIEQKAVLITKKECLNSIELSECCHFTAGIETWKTLAKNKVWVHGTTDSMGDLQLPELKPWIAEMMNLQDTGWNKLTHQDSPPSPQTKSIATYELKYTPKAEIDFKNIKMIYWKSGVEFSTALKIWPEIKKISHACGMGQSAITIGSQIDTGKVTLYYDESDWRSSVLQTI